jgi:hypothetical protein
LAIVDEGCSINYCIKTGALSAQGLPKVQRPPFMDAPKDGFTMIDSESVVISSDGALWTTMEDADVMVPKFMAQHGMMQGSTEAPIRTAQYNSGGNRAKKGLSGGGIAAISISATLACVLIGTVIVITIRRRRNRGGLYRESDPWAGEGRNINPRSTRNYSNMEDNTPTVSTRT